MTESLFNIFGDHLRRQVVKNVSRQPLQNIENMGKSVSTGPLKPNEPVKKAEEPKKSFMCNAGKALQGTPLRQVFSPRPVNMAPVIYNDELDEGAVDCEPLELTKPTYLYDNYHRDMFDYLPVQQPLPIHVSPPSTPPPNIRKNSMETMCSYEEDFFTDDYSNMSMPEIEDLDLPDIY